MGKILPPSPPGTPGPFSGNLIIFGVGPRSSSTKPSPSTSAEPGSALEMTEAERQEQLTMMRKTDEAMSRDHFKSREKSTDPYVKPPSPERERQQPSPNSGPEYSHLPKLYQDILRSRPELTPEDLDAEL